MRNRYALTAFAALAILLDSSASAALAAPSTLVPTGPGATAPATSATVDALQELVGTQTEAEIQAIQKSGSPAELLFDSATGEYIAARFAADDVSPLAITPVGPGCTTTSVCMLVGGQISYGFTGTGTLNGTWNSVTRAAAGSLTTHFLYAGGVYDLIVPATQAAYPTPPINVNQLKR